MQNYMKLLGVSNAREWEELAWKRLSPFSEEQILRRRNTLMGYSSEHAGVSETEVINKDDELLITGRMAPEEFKQYISQKIKEEANNDDAN